MRPVPPLPIYRRTLPIIALLVCCAPAGLALMWLFAPWRRQTKGVVTGVLCWLAILGAIFSAPRPTATPAAINPTPTVVAVAARPTTAPPAPTPAPTQVPPTSPPATEPPAPTAAPAAERVAVTGAGADGVNMRAEPSATAGRVKLLRDGQPLEIAGEDRDAGGRTWRNVRDPGDGATGWVAAEFVGAPGVAVAAAPPPSTKPGAVSPDMRAYLDWLQPKTEIVGTAFKGLSDQSLQAGSNPALLTNNEWRTKTTVALAFLLNTGQEMQKYPKTIPPEGRQLDGIIKGMGGDLVYIANEYAAALDTGNGQRLQNSTTRMNGIPAKAQAATAEIQRLNTQGAVPASIAAPKPVAPSRSAAGAIVCNDGSTWPSMTRQGACSRRGGIAPGY